MTQSLRIIGGLYRGKKIYFPSVEGLRPTPDRVRETLFNWLMNHIRGADCLDLFAGSGALGFEAFSRSANLVVFIESNNQAFAALQETAKTLNSSKLKLQKIDAVSYLQKTKEQFDILFLDPPFSSDLLPKAVAIIEQRSLLKSGGLLYLESAEPIVCNEERWTLLKSKKAGQVYYALLQKN